MSRKLTVYLLNFLFFGFVSLLAVGITTYALAKKANDYREQTNKEASGTVIKEIIPALTFTKGIVKNVNVKVGQSVKKGQLLLEVDNPVLREKVDTLQKFKNNSSAQTEARVAEAELEGLNVVSSVDGVIGEINVNTGSPVDDFTKVITIYSNDNVRLLSHLSFKQFQLVQKLHEVRAYSPRLNQSFVVLPELLNPNETTNQETKEKKIGLYFKFKDPLDAASLLSNEDLNLELKNKASISRPIDIFVNFWKGFLSNY